MRLVLVRNARARRYILRVLPDGVARVTVPRGGSAVEARAFAVRQVGWIAGQLQHLSTRTSGPAIWTVGSQVYLRGELVPITMSAPGELCLGNERLSVADSTVDARPAIEKHLWAVAASELPSRVWELATVHRTDIRRVTVRNQRTRWGSCSRRGCISLNWRLIQTPDFVRDYIILHELMHVREMNHSNRFWRQVALACPNYLEAERWLKQHRELLR